MGQHNNGHAGQFGDPSLGQTLFDGCAFEDKVAFNGENHNNPGGAAERSMLQESKNATPWLGVPKGLQDPEGQGQVKEDDPDEIESVGDGQGAQVNDGSV